MQLFANIRMFFIGLGVKVKLIAFVNLPKEKEIDLLSGILHDLKWTRPLLA